MTSPAADVESDARAARVKDARRQRYALRYSLWQTSSLPSVRGCGRNVNTDAGVATLVLRPATADTAAAAGFSGLTLCSSIWACPCCSARIRQARAVDIEAAGVEHLRRGGGLSFLTLTMPHDAGDALADTLEVVLAGWRKLLQRKWFRDFRERHVLGFIRSVEVTYTAKSDGGAGWHPHLHVLLLAERPLSADARADLLGKLEDTWEAIVTAAGFRAPRRDGIGVNLRDVEGRHSAAALFAYLAKVQDGEGKTWNLGTEMMRGDLKSGRRSGALTPFDLAEQGAAGSGLALQLWHEYEAATKGRRAMHWSEGLRARLLGSLEVPDEEVPEVASPLVEPAPERLTLAALTGTEWRSLCRHKQARTLLPLLLEHAEKGRYEDLYDTLADALAGEPPDPGAPVQLEHDASAGYGGVWDVPPPSAPVVEPAPGRDLVRDVFAAYSPGQLALV